MQGKDSTYEGRNEKGGIKESGRAQRGGDILNFESHEIIRLQGFSCLKVSTMIPYNLLSTTQYFCPFT